MKCRRLPLWFIIAQIDWVSLITGAFIGALLLYFLFLHGVFNA